MKETGLMFKAPLVRTILSGQKTQTRRLMKKQSEADQKPGICMADSGWHYAFDKNPDSNALRNSWKNPRPIRWDPHLGQPGDSIYVRETFALHERECFYRADSGSAAMGPWTPAIHMPKALARIWLEITGVRVERLQDICEGDADREGVELKDGSDEPYSKTNPDGFRYRNYLSKDSAFDCGSAHESFRTLWESTGGDWSANPWVWVIDFKRIEKP